MPNINGTTINGLNSVSAVTANDEIPVWDVEASGEPTKKITAQNLASSVKSLASLPNTTEMNTAIAQSTATIVGGVTPAGSVNAQFCFVRQSGKVVSVNGALINVPITANTHVLVGTLTGVSLPPSDVRSLCGIAAYAYDHPQDTAYVTITPQGAINVNSTLSGTKAVYFSITYIAN